MPSGAWETGARIRLAGGKEAGSQPAGQMGKPQETAGRKAMGAKARKRYAGPAANYEKQTVGNRGAAKLRGLKPRRELEPSQPGR